MRSGHLLSGVYPVAEAGEDSGTECQMTRQEGRASGLSLLCVFLETIE